jgi:hypothetical protein
MLLLTVLLAALLPTPPAQAATVTATLYSSDTSSEAFRDFALPSNAGNIQVSVNTGTVQSQSWNADGTYRVRVGGGSVTATETLHMDIDFEHLNIRTQTYNSSGALLSTTYSWDNHDNHPTVWYNQNGYVGTLHKWQFTEAAGITYQSGANTCKETIYTGYYKGQVSKQATVYVYSVTVTYNTSGGGGPITPPPPQPTPTVPVSSETYAVSNGETLYVPIRAVHADSFTGKTFTVTYSPAHMTFTGTQDSLFYIADGASIASLSHNAATGVITFTVSKPIPSGETWTGVVAIWGFTSKINGITAVGVSMN